LKEFPSAFLFEILVISIEGGDGAKVISVIIREINLERKEDAFNEEKRRVSAGKIFRQEVRKRRHTL
jgi:hypothetical protein